MHLNWIWASGVNLQNNHADRLLFCKTLPRISKYSPRVSTFDNSAMRHDYAVDRPASYRINHTLDRGFILNRESVVKGNIWPAIIPNHPEE